MTKSSSAEKTKPSAITYILKLGSFTAVCILGGIVVLILMFAPATNPRFLNELLYRGSTEKDVEGMAKCVRMLGSDFPSLAIYDSLLKPQSKDDFKDCGEPEEVKFTTSDGQNLVGWYFKGPSKETVLVCYDGFGKRLPVLAGYVEMLRNAGLSAFFFDYRGFRDPQAKPDMKTGVVDAQAALDALSKRGVAADNLIILGRNFGAHFALKLAAANKCKALILEEPWTTVKESVEGVPMAGAMRLVPEWLYTDDCLNNIKLVNKNHAPILVVTAEPQMTGALKFYNAVNAPKAKLFIEDFMPIDLCPDLSISGKHYSERIKTFLAGQLDGAKDGSEKSIKWRHTYSEALSEAKQSNKPMFIDFTAPWCVYCTKLDMTTYEDSAVIDKLNSDYIPVKLDSASSETAALVKKFPFDGLPTLITLDAKETLLKKETGYMSPDKFLQTFADQPQSNH